MSLSIDSETLGLYKYFSPSWKLHFLKISACSGNFPFDKFLKNYINSKLNSLSLTIGTIGKYFSKTNNNRALIYKRFSNCIEYFYDLKELHIDFPFLNSQSRLEAKKSLKWTKLKNLKKLSLSSFSSHVSYSVFQISSLDKLAANLEEFRLIHNSGYVEDVEFFPCFQSLKNLRHLAINLNLNQVNYKYFGSIVNCSQLETISLIGIFSHNFPLDSLSKLKNLKEVSFYEPDFFPSNHVKKLDYNFSFEKLEKVCLVDAFNLFSLKNMNEALQNSSCLRELKIGILFKDLGELFDGISQCSLENLSIRIFKVLPPYGKPMKIFTTFLKKQN